MVGAPQPPAINTRRTAADSVKPTHTLCPKNAPGSTSGNLAKTYFTVRKVKKFATKLMQRCLPHLKHVAALPREIKSPNLVPHCALKMRFIWKFDFLGVTDSDTETKPLTILSTLGRQTVTVSDLATWIPIRKVPGVTCLKVLCWIRRLVMAAL